MWRLAIGVGGAPAFARLAELRMLDRQVDQAATFYECASELDPDSVVYRAKLATAFSELGRCEEADEVLSDADYYLSNCSCREGAAASAIRVANLRSRQMFPPPVLLTEPSRLGHQQRKHFNGLEPNPTTNDIATKSKKYPLPPIGSTESTYDCIGSSSGLKLVASAEP
jgi:hypothetical protein